MNRRLRYRGALALTCAAALGGSLATASVATATPTPSTMRVAGTSAHAVHGSTPTGAVNKNQPSTIQIWMKPDTSAATAYANAVSTPGSVTFHHYLSPSAYTSRFAASAASTRAVASWLKSKGFTSVQVGAQRDFVRATGTVGTTESAFAVHINHYRVRTASGTRESIAANDRDVTLPASLATKVIGVTGMDNVQPQTFHSRRSVPSATAAAAAPKCSTYYGQYVKTGLPAYRGSTSFPTATCGYSGAQLRQAYGMTSSATGKGQTIAYIEIGTPYKMEATLQKWASTNGLPAPKSTNYQQLVIGRGNDCGNFFDIEEQLDIEAGYAMAPDARQLLVGGDSCAEQYQGVQPLFDADLAVVNGTGSAPYASMTSNSWGLTGGESFPAVYSNVLHAILVKAAAEGVGMYYSSGDNPGISVPADDPYATAVGGTSLGLGQNGQRLFETGWSNETLALVDKGTKYIDEGIGRSAAGGGTALLWKEPAYQKGVVPRSMTNPGAGNVSGLRAVPDISAVADAYTGISQGVIVHTKKGDRYEVFADGGTSLAAPLVSGMIAAAQQGRRKSFGFLNPVLYRLAGSAAFHDALPVTSSTPVSQTAVFCPETNELCFGNSLETFDSQTKANTDQVTAKGYDTMSGVGTPNGQNFIAALRKHG